MDQHVDAATKAAYFHLGRIRQIREHLTKDACTKSDSAVLPNYVTRSGAVYYCLWSNADAERAFSMVQKIKTETRTCLGDDTVNSLMSVKINSDKCCFEMVHSPEVLKAAQSSTWAYNKIPWGLWEFYCVSLHALF
ncbi:hypothetical protein CAPTEDRAFT_206403 [Capitella teleta]|uniref:Uncharacterized protein n=1 Tax=Capitella teleta TaxID=283909 RepID=R7T8S4_CAPTE|nr:hypothetical protein CAPTEDRAFT_206403 [Capitella teleta]|eukprot:ELT90030.1 hypothetical protein CAPTEDRAFT_206403 [Capitella teleta]